MYLCLSLLGYFAPPQNTIDWAAQTTEVQFFVVQKGARELGYGRAPSLG